VVISDKLRCVFVHVQKTGGSSIEAVLRQNDPQIGSPLNAGRRHQGALELKSLLPAQRWDSYFKFAFVRNPWDRLVSWYFMCVQATAPNAFARYVMENVPTFEDFVVRPTGILERTTRNQLDYLVDADGRMLVDRVGRYEALDADFSDVMRRLGISGALPRANPSAHESYRHYYGDDLRAIVARRFARDIEAFGYTF